MGDLLLFRPSATAARPPRAEDRSEDARILFFTGVRYGRQEPSAPVCADQGAPPRGGLDGRGGGRRKRRG